MFGITPRLYAQSLVSRQRVHFPEDIPQDPNSLAERYVCALFPTVDKVLSATRDMIAQQIAADPALRNFIRRVYMTDAVVTVAPTSKGRAEINSSHKYYPFKYLTNKFVMDFKDGQFLQILAAESEGLVTISARVDMEEELIKDMIKHYHVTLLRGLEDETPQVGCITVTDCLQFA